jgi:hypothetical protein
VADAVGVPEHGDVRVLHDVLNELVGTPGDDEVDVLLHLEHLGRLLARRQQRHHVGRGLGCGQPVLNRRQDGLAALDCLTAALEQHAVARLDTQRRDLNRRVGAGFKNDSQHSERHSDALHREPWRQLAVELHESDGIGEFLEITHAGDGVAELGTAELQARLQGRSHLGLGFGSFLAVESVGLFYIPLGVFQRLGHTLQRVVAVLVRQR